MSINVTINGVLTNDQSAGLQTSATPDTGDDVALGVTVNAGDGNDVLTGSLDADFLSYLNTMVPRSMLTDAQMSFAANVDGASEAALVSASATNGETISKLFFSDSSGQPLDGDQVYITPPSSGNPAGVPMQTVDGQNIYLWSVDNGAIVLATTSNVSATSGSLVAAFYIEANSTNTSAKVEMATFMPIAHPDSNNPDDTLDFSDVLQVSAAGTKTFPFDGLDSGDHLWVAVGDSSGAVLVTSKTVEVDSSGKKTNSNVDIHTSQGGDGTTIGVGNQLFDHAGETAVFTLVEGLTSLGASGPDATGDYLTDQVKGNKIAYYGIDYNNYINATGAGIYLSQSQGTPSTPKALDITVLNADANPAQTGLQPEQGFGYRYTDPTTKTGNALTNDAPVNVQTVTIYAANSTTPIGTWALSPSGTQFANGSTQSNVTVTISQNVIHVQGVNKGYTIDWTTTDTFNRFDVTSVANGDGSLGAFDIGKVIVDNVVGGHTDIGDFLKVDDSGPKIGNSDGVSPAIANSIVSYPNDTDGATSGHTAFDVSSTGPISLGGNLGTDPNAAANLPYTLTSWSGTGTATDPKYVVDGVTMTAIANATNTSVSYWGDTNGVAGIQITGTNPDLEFYRLTLGDQGGAGSYTFQVLQNPPVSETHFGFGAQPSGQNLFGIIPAGAAQGPIVPGGGLLFFTSNVHLDGEGKYISSNSDPSLNSGTVNTSKGGGDVSIGYGANNFTATSQNAFFVYADDPNISAVSGLGLNATSADDADTVNFKGLNPTTTASVDIVKIVSSGEAGVTIRAWDLDDSKMDMSDNSPQFETRGFLTNPLNYLNPSNTTPVDINAIQVFRVTHSGQTTTSTLVYSAQDANNDHTFSISETPTNTGNVTVELHADGTVTVTGLDTNADYTIKFTTVTPHDMAEVDWATGSYNIGGFTEFQAVDTPDLKFDFTAQIKDGDGDTATASWHVGVDGTGQFDNGAVTGVLVV